MKHKEGSVVSCVSKIKVEEAEMKQGTVWMALNGRYIVLDKEGYLHECLEREVFEVDNEEVS